MERSRPACGYTLVLCAALAGCVTEVSLDAELEEEAGGVRPGCSGIRVPDVVPSGLIALTFDDGPNPATTPIVLDVLARHGAPATFFVNGRRMAGHEALLDRIVTEGHELGNHTHDHRGAVRECSGECLRNSVLRTDELIRQHQPGAPRFFRFPYGEANCAAVETVRSLGYRVVGWQIDTQDWDFAGDATSWRAPGYEHDFEGWVQRSAAVTGGGVLLMHDIHANTASHLDSILTRLEDAGFHFVSLDSGHFPLLNAGPDEITWMDGPAAIPDGAETGLGATIEIESSLVASDVVVLVDVVHARPRDLALALEHDGRSYELALAVETGATRLRAAVPIPGLAGSELRGIWTLRVIDAVATESGTLRAWSIVNGRAATQ